MCVELFMVFQYYHYFVSSVCSDIPYLIPDISSFSFLFFSVSLAREEM